MALRQIKELYLRQALSAAVVAILSTQQALEPTKLGSQPVLAQVGAQIETLSPIPRLRIKKAQTSLQYSP